MLSEKLYRGSIWLLAAVHIYALLPAGGASIFIAAALSCILAYAVYRITPDSIASPGAAVNTALFLAQLLIAGIHIRVAPVWAGLCLFIAFFCMEFARRKAAIRLQEMNNGLLAFEEQQSRFNETFRTVRSERHDFLKHVSAIHYLMENQSWGEAKGYMDRLVDGYKETNLSIKGESGAVAGLLHDQYRKARQLQMAIVYDLDIPVSSLPLSDKEIVMLFGNILSNGIEACREWQEATGRESALTLQFSKRSGLFLIDCKNDCLPIPNDILDNLFKTPGKTTKGGNHEGLGTSVIADVVRKYNGRLDFVHKNNSFSVRIKIPAIN